MKYRNTEDIMKTLEEAPATRKALLDNHSNLKKVADYCENKYSNTEDTAKAVEEAKALTTQALASVAYQINTLAGSLVRLLDGRTIQLMQLESSVNILSMTVDMYKEKVARQEIGVVTAPSKIPYVQKMVPPARPEEPNSVYERVPISYTSLDLVGHGVWNGDKTAPKKQLEPQTTIQQPSTQEGRQHFGAGTGIAVPPPSVPNWAGLKTPASSATPVSSMPEPPSFSEDTPPPPPPPPSSDTDDLPPPPPLFPQSSPIAVPTPSSSPFSSAFTDLFLPPPPTPQTEFLVPPPPPPPPPPAPANSMPPPSFGGSFPASPPAPPEYVSMAPPSTRKDHVPPPPPLRSAPGVGSSPSFSLPLSPPTQYNAPPPPPPLPTSPGKAFIPPAPPPPPF